jgi:hypothetical protein
MGERDIYIKQILRASIVSFANFTKGTLIKLYEKISKFSRRHYSEDELAKFVNGKAGNQPSQVEFISRKTR